MPQVQVLPYVPGFGEQFAQAIGEAASTAGKGYFEGKARKRAEELFQPKQAPQYTPNALEEIQKVAENNPQTQEQYIPGSNINIPQIAPQNQQMMPGTNIPMPQPPQQSQKTAFEEILERGNPGEIISALNVIEQGMGKEAANNALKLGLNEIQTKQQMELEKYKIGAKEKSEIRKENRQEQRDVFKQNEPRLVELEHDLDALEQEDNRLARLQVLYSDPSKFPNATLASLFSKEGQINPVMASQLTPEAQESIKLVIDSLQGAQATFGGKVSNFEAATYMKRNATLFNTPEGRERILTDLRKLNEMTRFHHEGVLETVQKHGGPNKISLSGAERIWKQEHKKEIEALKKNFINPKEESFKEFPAEQYKGRTLRDKDSKKLFKSDGVNWNPVEGAQ